MSTIPAFSQSPSYEVRLSGLETNLVIGFSGAAAPPSNVEAHIAAFGAAVAAAWGQTVLGITRTEVTTTQL